MRRFRNSRTFRENRVLFILLFILLAILLVGVLSIAIMFKRAQVDIVAPDKVDSKAKEVKIAQYQQKDDDVFNVLLVGSDSRDPNGDMGRSDSMMLVSFNKHYGKATIISFLRDSLVDIDGYGMDKLGHTYAYGGVGLTINTLNKNYDLDIQNYITINFENLVGIIDTLGGVEVYISAEEAAYYRQIGMPDIQEGYVNLSGSRALVHARNRTIGSDFERTRRQRSVMYGIYNKVMEQKDPATILPLIEYCLTQVNTNMSVTDIYEWATVVLGIDNLLTQQSAIPADGTYTSEMYNGMAVLKIDFEANKEKIKTLLY